MLSLFGIRRPYTVIVAVVAIAILGAVSIVNMSIDLLPNINLPYAIVITPYIGASPEQVEMGVTKPVEQAMASISNINNVQSISAENMSVVILEFTGTANMDTAVIEMREGLDPIGAYLPDSAGSPMIMKLNPEMMPVMVLSAAVEGKSITESSAFIEGTIIPALESVEGVASVSASGLIEQQIIVRLNDEKIARTTTEVQGALMSALFRSNLSSTQSSSMSGSLSNMTALLGMLGKTSSSSSQTGAPMGSSALSGQFDPKQLVSKETIAAILMGQNFEMPAGYVSGDGSHYLVRVGDDIADLSELRNLPIFTPPMPGVEPVVLEDIADIIVVDNSGEMYTKVNGTDAAILTVQKQTEYATSDVSEALLKRIDDLRKDNPGVQLVPLMDQGQYIRMAMNSITKNLLVGAVLAIAILLLFLKDIRPTLIVGLSIPVSLIAAFAMMYFSGVSLNMMSMGGLALGVGMLVDNSIVVIENIYRMRAEGKSPIQAAAEGATEVTGALIASTLTTVAVFLPIIFTQGLTRQLFTDMGLTITYSLLASLLVALGLVPMVASRMRSRSEHVEHRSAGRLRAAYATILSRALDHKALVVLLVAVLFIGSMVGGISLGTELIPQTDTGQVMVTVSLPKGSTLTETAAAADKVMSVIQGIPEVETVGATVGAGRVGIGSMGALGGGTDSVTMYVLLREKRDRSTAAIAQEIRDKTSGVEFEVTVNDSTMDISALTGSAIAVNVKGRDLDTLGELAKQVAELLESVPGTVDVSDGLDRTEPELRIVVDKQKSLAHGLTVAQVFLEISQRLASDSAATTISIGSRDVEVYVEDSSGSRMTVDDIAGLVIASPQGTEVALSDIAALQETTGPRSITRESQQRYVTVSASLAEGYNIGKVSSEIQRRLADLDVPEGYTLSMGGEQELLERAFDDLYLMLALAIVLIYLVMVVQFQSLLSPFIVMFTIPLAFTGGFLGLIVARMPISMPALLGFIVLSGVVVNNAIVLVDYVNQLMSSGMTKRAAIMKAGNDRLRPVLMTALTTILALVTTSAGMGQGAEIMQPVAVAAIGGLLYATLLTLVFIPVLYDRFVRERRSNVEETASV